VAWVVSAKTVLVQVSSIELFVTLDQLIHFLLGIVEASPSFVCCHLHILFKHHDLILLVCVFIIVVRRHIQPRVR
jgi:hypothetical protein